MAERSVSETTIYPPLNSGGELYLPPPAMLIEKLPSDRVIGRLGFNRMPLSLRTSVMASDWQVIGNGRIFLEIRNPRKLRELQKGDAHASDTHVLDLDDCMLDTSSWHKREYLIAEQEFGIDKKTAKDIYEESKIFVPGVAENEKRYTPELNLFLLSRYKDLMTTGASNQRVSDVVSVWREIAIHSIRELGELSALSGLSIDADIYKAFVNNSPADFVHDEFVEDVIGGSENPDLRIIATRGKIEGPLGQIDKVHRSGVLEGYGREDNIVDLVLYTNDIKAEALLDMLRLMPMIGQSSIRIYDDNPSEVLPYIESARAQGVNNLEVIQVGHPTAKRRGVRIGVEPDFSIEGVGPSGEPKTSFDHYFAFPPQTLSY